MSSTPKLTKTLAALALAVTLLAGCTATSDPEPQVAESTAADRPIASTEVPPSADPAPEQTTPTVGVVPVDSGPRPSANGTTESDASGTPVAYIVAEGDTAWAIEQRFGIDGVAERYNRYLQLGERLSLVP